METRLAEKVRACFAAEDADERARLAVETAVEPGFDRSRTGELLHGALTWPRLKPGRHEMTVPVGLGHARRVTVRIPRGYSPDQRWPLVYLLHTSGGDGPSFLSFGERALGRRLEDFVIAAPTHYRQTGLDAPPPFTADHTSILRAVRRAVHLDGDRQIVLGYSLGGYASWAVAYLHGEELAAAVPVGSCFSVPPTEDGLWRAVLPNFAQVPVLNVWGGRDSLTVIGNDGRRKTGIADMNRRFIAWTKGMPLPVRHVEIPGKGHGGLTVPQGPLSDLLAARRVHYPLQVDHTFRHLHQGRAYWLEAHEWQGGHWGDKTPKTARRPGESEEQAFGRGVRGLLAHLKGTIEGQAITVETEHVQQLTVWLGDGMIDWSRPVTLDLGGRRVFSGTLQPDLALCLAQAARTFDLDRLRWAGLRLDHHGHVEPVTAETRFPPLEPQ